MNWLRNLMRVWRRERNRKRRWRERTCYTWPRNDWREFTREWEAQERRARQS